MSLLRLRLSFSREFHLGRCCGGSRVTIDLTGSACASQDPWLAAVLEERTDANYGHHRPILPYKFFYIETFKYTREGGGEIIELGFCE